MNPSGSLTLTLGSSWNPLFSNLCLLRGNLDKIQASDVLERMGLEKDRYILLSAHREENIDTETNITSLFTAINALAEKYDLPILYSCHPRSKQRLEKSGFKLDPRVRMPN